MRFIPLIVCGALLAGPSVPAQEQRTVSQESIVGALIENLGANDHATRERAEESLRRLGPAALEPLEKAALSDDPEVRVRAGAILADLRLGITPDWPEAAIDLVREWHALDDNARRQGLRTLPQMLGVRVAPFMLRRMEKGSDYESRYAFRYLRSYLDKPETWRKVMDLIREPRCKYHRDTLAWARTRSGMPIEALNVLAQEDGHEPIRKEAIEASVKQLLDHMERGRVNELLEGAEKLVKAAPAEARFLYLQAEAIRALGKEKESTALRAKALALNPAGEAPHWSAAEMLAGLGRLSMAAKEWETILKIPPAGGVYDINAHLRLAGAYRESGLFGEAAQRLTLARDLFLKARESGKGMAIIGGDEQDLMQEIERLQRKAQQFPAPAKGVILDRERQKELHINVAVRVKDDLRNALEKALASADASMTMNVQPEGFRIFDKAPATIRYDAAKKEIGVFLNAARLCKPVPFQARRPKPRVAVRTLDCVYLFEFDAGGGKARQVARFEKDYTLTFKLQGRLAEMHNVKVTLNKKLYEWQQLVRGAEFDYLPRHLEIHLEGADGRGRRIERKITVRLKEPKLFRSGGKRAPEDG